MSEVQKFANGSNICTRCKFAMPIERINRHPSADRSGLPVWQSRDSHNAEVYIQGGYDEFYDGNKLVANLCQDCGYELLSWLKTPMAIEV